MRKLSFQELEDLIDGATILGCGGGGNPERAMIMIREALSKGKEFSLLDPQDLSEDSWICILSYVGGGIKPKEKKIVQGLARIWEYPLLNVSKELSQFMRVEFDTYLPSEIGAGNTVATLFVAAMEGKPVLDGDAAGGRAKPELVISTTHLIDLSPTPLAIASHYGDALILKESIGDKRVEDLCRFLSRASGGTIAVARCPSRGARLKKAIHPYSITLAIEVGRAVREDRTNPLDALIKRLNGAKRFEGRIKRFSRKEKDGFVWGDIYFEGFHEYRDQMYRIWFKNENLIGWRDENLDITCPDAIIMVDTKTGKGVYNWGGDLYDGREVTVIGMKAPEIWKTKKGLEIFGPRHFGFNFPSKMSL